MTSSSKIREQVWSTARRVQLIAAIARYLRDPNQVESVLRVGNQLITPERAQLFVTKQKQNPEVATLISSKYDPGDFPLAELRKLPKGTLGYEYIAFVEQNRLNAEFYQTDSSSIVTTPNEEYNFLVNRLRKTHDLWHVVTGFASTQEGEVGLLAFYYAQIRSPLSALLVGLSFLHFLMRRPSDLELLFDEITRGWNLSRSAKSLVGVRWENHWETPIETLRQELHLQVQK